MHTTSDKARRTPTHFRFRFEHKLTLLYLFIGLLWIFFSDKALELFFDGHYHLTLAQTGKGFFYVGITALLLYLLVSRHEERMKQAEKKHKEASEHWQQTFDAISDIVLLLSPAQEVIELNRAALKYLNISRENAIGKKCYHIVHHTDLPLPGCPCVKALERNEQAVSELIQGEKVYELTTWPVFDSQQAVIAFVHVIKDITERKATEKLLKRQNEEYAALNEEYTAVNEELEEKNQDLSETNRKLTESEEHFRLLVENAPEAIFIQTDWRFAYLNKEALKLFGAQSVDQIVGTLVVERFHPDFRELVAQRIRGLNELKISQELVEEAILQLDGTRIDVEVSAIPFEFKGKAGALVFVREITERKKFIADIQREKERAEQSDQLKSAFLENLSHEVRTPMNAILGFSDLLLKPDIQPHKLRLYTDTLHTATAQLLATIENTLTIAHLKTNQIEIHRTQFRPNDLIDRLYTDYLVKKERIGKAALKLIASRQESDERMVIYSDYTRIYQIMSELLDNALKFTQAGEVKFGYTAADSRIHFFVKDTGMGIPTDKRELILKSFTQADKSVQRLFGGLGVGLSIVSGLTERLGGELTIDSDAGKGTLITCSLPIK